MSVQVQFQPRLVGFLCNWCCYAGADLAGVSRYQYPAHIRIIRLMCSGRVDPRHVLRAFRLGADGVFIGGCWLGECHYVTEGNHDALAMMYLTRKLLARSGVDPRRLRLEWVSASEGIRFSEVMSNFSRLLEELGPLGKGQGKESQELGRKLRAAEQIVPYLKMVERERLRVRLRNDDEYRQYFESAEVERLFSELVDPELRLFELMHLLEKESLPSGEIAARLQLAPAEAASAMRAGLRRGLLSYDAATARWSRTAGAGRI